MFMSQEVLHRDIQMKSFFLCVFVCAEKTETAESAFERHESKLVYKQMTKGAKTRDEARPKREGDRGGKRETD